MPLYLLFGPPATGWVRSRYSVVVKVVLGVRAPARYDDKNSDNVRRRGQQSSKYISTQNSSVFRWEWAGMLPSLSPVIKSFPFSLTFFGKFFPIRVRAGAVVGCTHGAHITCMQDPPAAAAEFVHLLLRTSCVVVLPWDILVVCVFIPFNSTPPGS